MTSAAAIYARVSSARQKKDETIASQTAALRAHAEQLGLDVPDDWVFEDEGHSGATLVRPALERLRDLVAGVGIDVVLCYSPDRLARKFAYQALLIEEFTRAGHAGGVRQGPPRRHPGRSAAGAVPGHVRRVREGADPGTLPARQGPPRPDRVDQRALRRPVRLPLRRARAPTPAPPTRSSSTRPPWSPSCSAATPTTAPRSPSWPAGSPSGVPTRTGKHRWDRSVVWGMLRNPAYAGQAGVRQDHGRARIPRPQPGRPLQGRAPPRARPRPSTGPASSGHEIPVPAIVTKRRSSGPRSGWPTTSASPPATPRSRPCCRAWPPARAADTATTAPHHHHAQEDLLLPVPGLRRLPLRSRPGLRQQAGPRRLPRHRSSGTTSPACWPTHLIRAEIDKRLDAARTADPVVQQRKR